ncbi:MAG TPA: hypothetical protein VL547_12680 [Dinghuibacter sp.]|uniref:hypothetical protein n=1 Tax=Dinghuibacter sp. TaxID=2024697 RepID=UPI002C07A426|nr:hypothetical protein [Dinghuibacter sp.]HTJ12881.1 hypothetical protein [Dinghuibacter sp.]
MNFDDLKDAWAKEPVDERVLPARLTGKTTGAIARLRRNMRNEFIWTILGLGATLVVLIVHGGHHRLTILAYCAAAFLFVQAGYYFFRFFLFYRRTQRYDLGLRKSLRRFVSELELNIEVYRTYSFCITPLACLVWIAIVDTDVTGGFIVRYLSGEMPTSPWTIIWIILTLLCTQFLGAFFLHLHLETQYTRYLKELRRILDDLED